MEIGGSKNNEEMFLQSLICTMREIEWSKFESVSGETYEIKLERIEPNYM